MNFRKIVRTIAFSAVMAVSCHSASAQDLLARQAPVDRRAASVDTMVFNRLKVKENAQMPASDLYDGWSNSRVHVSGVLPDEYRIDLRGFHMPTPSRVVTSNFGRRWGRAHQGLDIKVYIGDTIRAAWSGKVRVVQYDGRGYGKYVVIRHPNGLETYYGHMSKQLVSANEYVKAGQPIGLGGNTGRSTGSHLHFETRLCGHALNPALFFDFPNQDVTGDFYTYRNSNAASESARATALRGTSSSRGYSRENIQGDGKGASYKSKRAVEPAQPANETSAREVRPARPAASGDILYHKVQRGETLQSIAESLGTTVDRLCRLNGIGRYTRLTPGDLLKYQND